MTITILFPDSFDPSDTGNGTEALLLIIPARNSATDFVWSFIGWTFNSVLSSMMKLPLAITSSAGFGINEYLSGMFSSLLLHPAAVSISASAANATPFISFSVI